MSRLTLSRFAILALLLIAACQGPIEGRITHKIEPQGTVVRCLTSDTSMCYVTVYQKHCTSTLETPETRVATCTDKVLRRLTLQLGATQVVEGLPADHLVCFTTKKEFGFPGCIWVPGWLRQKEQTEEASIRKSP